MLRILFGLLPTKTLQNIINICAQILFKRKYWRQITSTHPELFIPQGFAIIISKTEKWEWKVKNNGNELCHGISPTEHLAILDGHLWIELVESEKKCNSTNSAEI
jgi:hypothetical protein